MLPFVSRGPTEMKGDKGDPGINGTNGTNGTNGLDGASFSIAAPTVTTLSTNDKNAVAFQPSAAGPSALIVNASIGGVLALNTKVTVSMCATQGGAYVDVCAFTLNLAVGGVGIGDGNSGTVFVPSGYWIKITLSNTGIISSVGGTKVVWNL